MDFTEIYKQSDGLVSFSPGAHFILTAVQDRLVVRRADSFQITRTWHVKSNIASQSYQSTHPSRTVSATQPVLKNITDTRVTHAGWSCDSEYVLAACAKSGFVSVFKLRDESWNACIDAGAEGLVKAEWAPDGRSILCFSAWGLRVTVWSLVTATSTYIHFPIHPDRGYAFRDDTKYFVLAERHKSKDTVGVYDTTETYRLVRHFPLPTSALASLSLSPTGNHIAVWEGPMEYKLYILSLSGDMLGSFCPEIDPGLGIRSVAWHPSGFFLVVAGWDDKIHILESLTWNPVATIDLGARVANGVTIWREPSDWLEKTQGRGFLSYERVKPPHSVPSTRPDLSKGYPKSGAFQLAFNMTGSLLLARSESMPTTAHLFSFPTPTPETTTRPSTSPSLTPRLKTVLIHTRPVMSAQWNPVRKGSLAVCCGHGSLFMWSDEWIGESGGDEGEEVAECIGVPAKKFETRDVKWAPDGKGLALLDKDTFCCAFEVEEDEDA